MTVRRARQAIGVVVIWAMVDRVRGADVATRPSTSGWKDSVGTERLGCGSTRILQRNRARTRRAGAGCLPTPTRRDAHRWWP